MNEMSPVANSQHYHSVFSQSAPPACRFAEMTRAVSSSCRRLGEGRDLLGYLYAKSAIGEEIEGELLARLLDANCCIRHTRKKLVRADAIGESTSFSVKTLNRRLYYLRTKLKVNAALPEPRLCAVDSVKSEFMRVGSCGEMASHVTANYLVQCLKKDEMAAVTFSPGLDHVWGEIHADGAPVVIMDAWSIGPAILKEDSRYAKTPVEFTEAYDASMQEDMSQLMFAAATALKRSERRHLHHFKRFWSDNENKELATFPNRFRYIIFSDAFMEKTSDDESASDLSRRLRATRVLRQLGLTTQDAVRYSDVVLHAYKNHLLNNAMR